MTVIEKMPKEPLRSPVRKDAAIVIPAYNGSRHWHGLHAALKREGIDRDRVLVVDSSSTDDTCALVRRAGYRLKKIPKEQFRHGATRQMAVDSLPWAEILIFLTQDALPCGPEPIQALLRPFDDPQVGAVYGRQLPRDLAGPIERHARLFNYPAVSDVRSLDSRTRLGIKAAFFSNSFAAYRRCAFDEVGGFPKDTIVSEEVTVAARMLMAGWKLGYQAGATVVHSHAFTVRQEFARYFDIGVHHGREKWLMEAFGQAGSEGRAFVQSEMRYLLRTNPALIPAAVLRTGTKWLGYQLGRKEEHLPRTLKGALSGQPGFWQDDWEQPSSSPSAIAAQISG